MFRPFFFWGGGGEGRAREWGDGLDLWLAGWLGQLAWFGINGYFGNAGRSGSGVVGSGLELLVDPGAVGQFCEGQLDVVRWGFVALQFEIAG